jgi:predicted TIM-barrel fold metal-dependent hydrolase
MPRLIDAHIHAYPAEVFADPRTWSEPRGETWWADCVAPTDRPSIQGWADVDTLLHDMDAAGIEQAVMLGWYWQQQSTCAEQNSWMAAWQQAHPDRLIAFAAVNPAAGAEAITQTQRWLDTGFAGIGELLDRVQGYRYDGEHFAALVTLAQEYRVPINLHVTDPKLDTKPGMMPTPLADFLALARRHPEVNFILAHLGGGLPWTSPDPLPRNLYFDTAAVPLIYEPDCYARALVSAGADRVIFGSDYPLRLYPRLSRFPDFIRMVDEIRAQDLSREHFAALMGGNLLSLLNRA